jgi:small-conductance mechanosensitive channel
VGARPPVHRPDHRDLEQDHLHRAGLQLLRRARLHLGGGIVPIPHSNDWQLAERILLEETKRVSTGDDTAQQAVRALEQRYPVPKAELEPRVFVRLTDNWTELAARFVVPVREARTIKSELARRVRERYDAAGIEIASTTVDVTVYQRERRPRREE